MALIGLYGVVCCIAAFVCLVKCDTADSATHDQGQFLQQLKDYEIVIPSRVTRGGDHVSYKIHPDHSLRRRSADFRVQYSDEDTLHYKVQIQQQTYVIQLSPNFHLISPGFVIERKKNAFKNVTDSSFTRLHEDHRNCHYHGSVLNQSDTNVALGVCDGLHGFIHTSDGEFFIEPIRGGSPADEGQHKHAVYRRSALPSSLDPLSSVHLHKRSTQGDDSCGVKDSITADSQRERWEVHNRQKRKSPDSRRRKKRSFSIERYVETLVVVDPSMIRYHKNEHLETYVLTIMNMVATMLIPFGIHYVHAEEMTDRHCSAYVSKSAVVLHDDDIVNVAAMFHDASIGNSINIVLVRILLMEEKQEELVITHHADNTLQSFCKFQKKINFKDDDHPNHHDVAILLTRKNICSRLDEPCSTLGLAQVSGMCQPHRSCNINEDTGLALAYTITHELGHNFGMHHDGTKNGCVDPPFKQLYIMSPSLVADSLSKSWSNCSRFSITKFIDRDWGYCLDDEPGNHEYKFPVLPPGTMYDADHQCRLQYGNDRASICSNQQDVCSNLWCRSDNRCSTHLEAAAEGTICGTNKWCYEGKCVKIGERPEAINGEWGQWTAWSECTRTCGAGISHSRRFCDNPQPSHGGKYCLGERQRYRICNTEDCPEDGVTFNEQQCAEFNYIPYKKGLYQWEHVQTSESPCQLHCKPTNQFFSVLLKDIVTDGTPCTPGTRNMCISGRCRHIGCDYVIDSKAVEDRCGVCHGDGSTCTTIKAQYNESKGLGYVEAAVIPKGARNIRVNEVAAANNFLALQNEKGEYYLNGHWFIQWSGDYNVAGTIVQYKREGNKESFEAAGPLKEPLRIMLLLQSDNPGLVFEYTVPKDNISEARLPEFHWVYQPWTHCTASCGGGSQRAEVVCMEIEAGQVEDVYCKTPKPDDKQKVCNDHLCPARWWTGPWQHCSVTCGENGSHQRTVICVRSLGPDEQIALDDEACAAEDKPLETEPCHKKDPCPGNSTWTVGEWSSCNGNLCGMKYRTVTCKDPKIGCELNNLPVSETSCSKVHCGQWVTESWAECTRSCGDGVQFRKVYCDGGDYCDTKTEPLAQQNCSLGPCPTAPPTTTSTTETSVPTTSITATEGVIEKEKDSESANDIKDKDVSTDGTDKSGVSKSEIKDLNKQRHTSDSTKEYEKSNEDYIQVENYNEIRTTTQANKKQTSPEMFNSADSIGTIHDTTYDSNDIAKINIEHSSKESIFNPADDKAEQTSPEDESIMTQVTASTPETTIPNQNTDNSGNEISTKTNAKSVTESKMKDDITETITRTNHPNMQQRHTVPPHKHRHHHDKHKSNSKMESSVHDSEQMESTNTVTDSKDDSIHDSTTEETTFNADNVINVDGNATEKHKNLDITIHSDNKDLKPLSKLPTPSKSDKLPSLPKLSNLPSLPNTGSLPDLPNIEDLAPLPDFKDLPPFPNHKTLPNLPDLDKLPPLPGKDTLAPLPDLQDLPPLPNIKAPKHPSGLLPPQSIMMKPASEQPSTNTGESNSKVAETVSDSELKATNDVQAMKHEIQKSKSQDDNEKDMTIATGLQKSTDTVSLRNSEQSSALGNVDISHTFKDQNVEPISRSENTKLDIGATSNTASETRLSGDLEMARNINEDDATHVLDRAASSVVDNQDDKSALTPKEVTSKPQEIYKWTPTNWSECSEFCGGGTQTRHVICVEESSGTEMDVSYCDVLQVPTNTQQCNTRPCVEWVATNWSQCSSTCGWSVRRRGITCPQEGSCDPKHKPIGEKQCDVRKCVSWVSGQWSRCTKKCDGGDQVRLVQCVNTTSQRPSRGCPYSRKPTEKRSCNEAPCQNNDQAALTIRCEHNEMSSVVCRALLKMGQCHRRFVSLKCCKTCNKRKHKKLNKNRPRSHALR